MATTSHAGQYLDLGDRNIVGSFYRRYESDRDGNWAGKIGWINNLANQETETYKMLGAVSELREWSGGRQGRELELFSYAIKNKVFESTLRFGLDDLRRDKTGQILARIGDLAARTADHWNKLLTDLIEDTTSTCYDGATFFNSAHSNGDSGSVDNLLVAGDVGDLNVATAADPTQDEMAKAVLGVIEKMYAFKDEAGVPVNGGAREFCVMVPANMAGATWGALRSERLSSGESNVLRSADFNVMPIVNPRLSQTADFFVFRTDSSIKPFILQEEDGVKVNVVGAGSEHEFKHREHLFGVEAVRNVGYGEFLYAAKATLS